MIECQHQRHLALQLDLHHEPQGDAVDLEQPLHAHDLPDIYNVDSGSEDDVETVEPYQGIDHAYQNLSPADFWAWMAEQTLERLN